MSIQTAIQHLVPQIGLTQLVGLLAETRLSPIKNLLIRSFIKAYQVDMSEALFSEPEDYSCFNDFFTRALKPEARLIAGGDGIICSPADGLISEFGQIKAGQLLQAKGQNYSVGQLIANFEDASAVEDGHYLTIYLAPSDYHRIHMPLQSRITAMHYIPGQLFSVNLRTAAEVEGLFARNERLVVECVYREHRYYLVLVGAMIVGGISTLLSGRIQRQKHKAEIWRGDQSVMKGDELGHFCLGSTVIMVTPPAMGVSWEQGLGQYQSVKMGQLLGSTL